MSSSVISEGFILIVVVIGVSVLSQVFMSSMSDIQHSTVQSYNELEEKIETDIKILSAVNVSSNTLRFWVKNTGSRAFAEGEIVRCDLFFGLVGDFRRYDYSESGEGWNYTILYEGDDSWDPTETLRIEVTTSTVLQSGDYYISYNTFNGVIDRYYFSLGG